MQIAVFGDVHGNIHALKSVLEDIESYSPDEIVCTGDLLTPYPGGKEVWDLLTNNNIPITRGNVEDKSLYYLLNKNKSEIHTSIRYKPWKNVLQSFSSTIIDELRNLPFTYSIEGPQDKKVLICHGTPLNNRDYLFNFIGNPQFHDFEEKGVNVIVAGHTHQYHHIQHKYVLLATAGAAGLSYNGSPIVEYLILEFKDNKWIPIQKKVNYDSNLLVEEMLQTDYLNKGSPLSWIYFDMILSHTNSIFDFLTNYCPNPLPNTEKEWKNLCQAYLKKNKRWENIEKLFT
ncbi:MAG: metallophosphoesterase family protein [Promethearchaeota archaeon]